MCESESCPARDTVRIGDVDVFAFGRKCFCRCSWAAKRKFYIPEGYKTFASLPNYICRIEYCRDWSEMTEGGQRDRVSSPLKVVPKYVEAPSLLFPRQTFPTRPSVFDLTLEDSPFNHHGGFVLPNRS